MSLSPQQTPSTFSIAKSKSSTNATLLPPLVPNRPKLISSEALTITPSRRSTNSATSSIPSLPSSPMKPTSAPRKPLIQLPVELWLYIAEFIPSEDLIKLMGVNRMFYEMMMNDLYSQLSFITADPRIFSEKVRTLQNPALASRVRKLTIWPSAVRDAIKAEDKIQPIFVPSPKKGKGKLLTMGKMYVDRLKLPDKKAAPNDKLRLQEPLPPGEQRVELFQNALKHLTGVEDFQLVWFLDNGFPRNLAWQFPFFPAVWRAVGGTIKKLTLDVQFHKMGDVIATSGTLPLLESFDLTLRREPEQRETNFDADGEGEQKPLSDSPSKTPSTVLGHNRKPSFGEETVVPYCINKMAPTLQHLSIKTIGHQQLHLFNFLADFPKLLSLSLAMPFDSFHQDPSGLRDFLRRHPGLKILSIRYTYCCRSCTDDGFRDGPQGSLTHKIFSGIQLTELHTLEMGLHIKPSQHSLSHPSSRDELRETPSAFVASIAQLGPNVTSLTLLDRSLSLAEIKLVLGAFPSLSKLKRLSLFAKKLTPQLVDWLAMNCGSLSSLSLDVERVTKTELPLPMERDKEDDIDGFVLALYTLAIDDDHWRYRTWLLSDVTILSWEFQVGKRLNWTCMQTIAGVVPTVRSFAGRGHMRQDVALGDGIRSGSGETKRGRNGVVLGLAGVNSIPSVSRLGVVQEGIRIDLGSITRPLDI